MTTREEIEKYVMERIDKDVAAGYVEFSDPDMTIDKYLALPTEEKKDVNLRLTPEGERVVRGTVAVRKEGLIGRHRRRVR